MTTTAANLPHFAANPLAFFEALTIPAASGPARFGDVMADFQRERFAGIVPALLAVARGQQPPINHFWWEATKGASKDSDLAAALLWLLAFTQRPLHGQIGAGDRDQANEMQRAAKDILRLNPWLSRRVVAKSWRIECKQTDSLIEIVAVDVLGAHGSRPDITIINELSHIGPEDFALTLLDNSSKQANGLTVIATNAGHLQTWQHNLREMVMGSQRWLVHKYDQPAPWFSADEIAEAAQRNSPSRYRRLWQGIWAPLTGDAIDPQAIEDSIQLKGPLDRRLPDWTFVAGLDLGVKKDHSALVVLGAEMGSAVVSLCECRSWSPRAGGQVDLGEVERAVISMHRRFGLHTVFVDPWNAAQMIQSLRRQNLHCEEMPFTGANLNKMAAAILDAFSSRSIRLYRDENLIRDLQRLSIVEKSYGYRLESVRDSAGHADRGAALAIALPSALEMAHKRAFVRSAPTRTERYFDRALPGLFSGNTRPPGQYETEHRRNFHATISCP